MPKYKLGKDGYFSTLIWDGSFNADGSKHYKRIRSSQSSRDLENKVDAFKKFLEDADRLKFTAQSFYDYSLMWLDVYKAAREKNTRAMYEGVIERYFTDLKGFPVSEIKHSHIQAVINNNLDHPRTCQQILLTFKQVIKAAVKDGFLPHSVLENISKDGISLPKYVKPKKRALNTAEKEALKRSNFCSSSDRKKAFVSLLYYTGIRRGEALALTPFDFNWKTKELTINKVIIFGKNNGIPELKDYPKSDNGVRVIPLPDKCINNIRPFVQECNGGFIFHGRYSDMMTLSAYNVFWKSILTELNTSMGYDYQAKVHPFPKPVDSLTAHIFRHNYCTELCYQIPTISTKKIAQLLGDTEKMVLDVYSHINEENEDIGSALKAALEI